MLINFFKNIFSNKTKLYYGDDAGHLLYQNLNLKSQNENFKLVNFLDNYPNICDPVLEDCLEFAIKYNDLPLIKKFYPYMKRNHRDLSRDNKGLLLFNYANIAMKANKIDVFDYFMNLYHDKNPGIAYVAQHSPSEFTNLIELIIDSKKVHYINILENYCLFNCHDYLTSYIRSSDMIGRGLINRDNDDMINFILDNFPLASHVDNDHSNVDNKKIDINKLLLEACKRNNIEKNIIINLVNRGADVNYNNSFALEFLIEREDLEMTKFLLDKGAKLNLERFSPHYSLYPWLEKWVESKKLFNELSNNLNNGDEPFKSKKNKL
jgi:hypothetical protein